MDSASLSPALLPGEVPVPSSLHTAVRQDPMDLGAPAPCQPLGAKLGYVTMLQDRDGSYDSVSQPALHEKCQESARESSSEH